MGRLYLFTLGFCFLGQALDAVMLTGVVLTGGTVNVNHDGKRARAPAKLTPRAKESRQTVVVNVLPAPVARVLTKIRCGYCARAYDETMASCPNCGARD